MTDEQAKMLKDAAKALGGGIALAGFWIGLGIALLGHDLANALK